SLIASEHDKMIVVDREWTLTGGRNIGAAYFTAPERDGHQFLDMDVLVRSSGVAVQMETAFELLYDLADPTPAVAMETSRRAIVDRARVRMDAWLRGYSVDLSDDAELRETEQRWQEQLEARPDLKHAQHSFDSSKSFLAHARVIDSHARMEPGAGAITKAVLDLIATTRHEVVLINPYLVLEENLARALADAARRGV